MALLPFTSNDEVRGILGVSSEELLNETLDLEVYELNLELALDSASDTLQADFLAINALTSGRTAVQAKLYSAVKLYSPYVIAVQLLPSLPMMAPKSISDGKASVSKFSESPFKMIGDKIMIDHDKYLANLLAAIAGLTGGTSADIAAPQLFRGVSSATDRVTNEAR